MDDETAILDIPQDIPPPLEHSAGLLKEIILTASKAPRNTQKTLHIVARGIEIMKTLRAPFSELPTDLGILITAMGSLRKLEHILTEAQSLIKLESELPGSYSEKSRTTWGERRERLHQLLVDAHAPEFDPPTGWEEDLEEIARVDDHLWVGFIAHDMWIYGSDLEAAREAERVATKLLEKPMTQKGASARKQDIENTMKSWKRNRQDEASSARLPFDLPLLRFPSFRSGSSSHPSSPGLSRQDSTASRGGLFKVFRGVTSQEKPVLTPPEVEVEPDQVARPDLITTQSQSLLSSLKSRFSPRQKVAEIQGTAGELGESVARPLSLPAEAINIVSTPSKPFEWLGSVVEEFTSNQNVDILTVEGPDGRSKTSRLELGDAAEGESNVGKITYVRTSNRAGGLGGQPFPNTNHIGVDVTITRISTIRLIHTNTGIDGIQVQYDDDVWMNLWGTEAGSAGLKEDSFTLKEDEFIVEVHGRARDKVYALQFTTSTGRKSRVYGGTGGTPFTWAGRPNSPYLFFLSGRAGDKIDQLQGYWGSGKDDFGSWHLRSMLGLPIGPLDVPQSTGAGGIALDDILQPDQGGEEEEEPQQDEEGGEDEEYEDCGEDEEQQSGNGCDQDEEPQSENTCGEHEEPQSDNVVRL